MRLIPADLLSMTAVASGVVSSCLVPADGGANGAALAAGEVES